jgi:hypothetical protein
MILSPDEAIDFERDKYWTLLDRYENFQDIPEIHYVEFIHDLIFS